jgi:hypothetical protein
MPSLTKKLFLYYTQLVFLNHIKTCRDKDLILKKSGNIKSRLYILKEKI